MTTVKIVRPSNARAMRAIDELFAAFGPLFIDVGGKQVRFPGRIRAILRTATRHLANGRSVALVTHDRASD